MVLGSPLVLGEAGAEEMIGMVMPEEVPHLMEEVAIIVLVTPELANPYGDDFRFEIEAPVQALFGRRSRGEDRLANRMRKFP
eukprot:4867601-Amphidinium_carterae.1